MLSYIKQQPYLLAAKPASIPEAAKAACPASKDPAALAQDNGRRVGGWPVSVGVTLFQEPAAVRWTSDCPAGAPGIRRPFG